MPGEAAALVRTRRVGKRRVTMTAPQIRINMVRPDTQHPDKHRRHQGRTWVYVQNSQRFVKELGTDSWESVPNSLGLRFWIRL